MAARLTLLLSRLAALVVIWLLALASFTFAADSQQTPPPTAVAKPADEAPNVLAVPDVRRQPYVFAKGMLQDAGFAWRVEGAVKGYAANTVAVQNPAPGVRVIDNGAPTVVLRLLRNDEYEERGLPENSSPYRGTPIVLERDWKTAQRGDSPKPESKPKRTATKPKAKRAAKTAPAAKAKKRYRRPDFVVVGARREPVDEMPLPDRARRLARRVAAASEPTPELVDYWLYQHSWVVTGALYGWKDGDEALRILIGVDRRVQGRFGFGAKSEAVARKALAKVLSRKS
jgi:hypothetical protein